VITPGTDLKNRSRLAGFFNQKEDEKEDIADSPE
jgi:hypothetical protein